MRAGSDVGRCPNVELEGVGIVFEPVGELGKRVVRVERESLRVVVK